LLETEKQHHKVDYNAKMLHWMKLYWRHLNTKLFIQYLIMVNMWKQYRYN